MRQAIDFWPVKGIVNKRVLACISLERNTLVICDA